LFVHPHPHHTPTTSIPFFILSSFHHCNPNKRTKAKEAPEDRVLAFVGTFACRISVLEAGDGYIRIRDLCSGSTPPKRPKAKEGTTKQQQRRKERTKERTTKERRRKEGSNLPGMYLHPTFDHIYPLLPMLHRGSPGCGYIGWDSLSLTLITLSRSFHCPVTVSHQSVHTVSTYDITLYHSAYDHLET